MYAKRPSVEPQMSAIYGERAEREPSQAIWGRKIRIMLYILKQCITLMAILSVREPIWSLVFKQTGKKGNQLLRPVCYLQALVVAHEHIIEVNMTTHKQASKNHLLFASFSEALVLDSLEHFKSLLNKIHFLPNTGNRQFYIPISK